MCTVTFVAYDDRQKAKRESIISRPLFSSSDKSLSSTPASAAMASSSSSSSSTKSAAVRRKLATLTKISSSGQASKRSTCFHSRSADFRPKLASSRNVFDVRRRASDEMLGLEPDTKRPRLTNTSTSSEQLDGSHNDKDLNHLNTDTSVDKVDVNDSQQLQSSPVNKADPHHTADALSLVSNYNSLSSSSNDSDWWWQTTI